MSGPESGVAIHVESPRADGVEELLRLGDEYALSLYPAENYYSLDVTALERSDVRMFVARDSVSHAALGTAAVALGPDDFAEVKRVFVRDEARGRGIARSLMNAAETYARSVGVRILRLETGKQQPAAIAMYLGLGFTEIDPFGQYVGDPTSVCFSKAL